MPAVQETIERVREIDIDQYKYGFVTDIESTRRPRACPRIPSASSRPRRASRTGCWSGGWRPIAAGWPGRADNGPRRLPPDRLPGPLLLFRAEAQARRQSSTRSIPKSCKTYAKLGIPLQRTGGAGRRRAARRATRSMRCSTASRSSPPSRRSWPRPGVIFCRFARRSASTPSW